MFPVMVALEPKGNQVVEMEEGVGKLTVLLDWMEEGRKMDVDERGGGFGRTAMADGGRGAIPAGIGPNHGRGGRRKRGVMWGGSGWLVALITAAEDGRRTPATACSCSARLRAPQG